MSKKMNDSVIAAFVTNSQELTAVVRRRSSEQLIDNSDLKQFEFELRDYHTMPANKICIHLNSIVGYGLKQVTASARLAKNGPNLVNPPADWPWWCKLVFVHFSGFAPLLWVATFLVFLSWQPFGTPPTNLYNLILAIVLIFVIVISSMFTFYQEMQATKILKGFAGMVPDKCVVIRDGAFKEITASALVVGDIVVLETGSRVPSDIRVISSNGMKVDKSMLTGESEPMRATSEPLANTVPYLEASNVLFMGSNIVEGSGQGVVVATGVDNQLAKIAMASSGPDSLTSLQVEVNRLVAIIATFALLTGITVVLVWAFNLRTEHAGFMTVSSMIANAIGVIVAYVPEGLPLALSMGLTIIAKRLCSKYFVLVKRLGCIETLGSMSLLASDKTGTLTQNLMSVTAVLTAADLEGEQIQPPSQEVLDFTRRIGALCNQASFAKDKKVASEGHVSQSLTQIAPGDVELGALLKKVERVAVGSNSTDRAVLSWVDNMVPVEVYHQAYLVKTLIPFSSATKVAGTVVFHTASQQTFVFVKGATEYLLPTCTSYLDASGVTVPMTETFRTAMQALINVEASKGRRMICTAQSILPSDRYTSSFNYTTVPEPNFPMTDLTFVSCVAVSDPPRVGVRQAVTDLRAAGIVVAMVTGDAAPTAVAIARQVNIVSQGNSVDTLASMASNAAESSTAIVVTGKEIETITPEQWDFIFAHKELVFARTTPEQKLQIVKESQERGHRVGVTGDGVNDSPALKHADVGIAMNSGSDVARDVAAIVLLKDDFTAIVHGVREGRLIFENLRKVIAYQISAGSWAEVLPVLATFFIGMPQPLSSFLMIMICCLSDVYGGVALMNEPAEGVIMRKPPRDVKKSRLFDLNLVCYAYFFYANLLSVGAFYNYFHYMASRGDTRAVPSPVPADDDGTRVFPAGYRLSQLIFAWNWGLNQNNLGADEVAAANVGSSLFYVTIVVGQMGHLLSIRRKTPYFYDAIMQTEESKLTLHSSAKGVDNRNVLMRMYDELRCSAVQWPVLAAWCGTILTANFFNYIPVFQQYCGTGVVPGKYWGMAVGWAVLWFTVAEIRKWIVVLYPESFIGRHAW